LLPLDVDVPEELAPVELVVGPPVPVVPVVRPAPVAAPPVVELVSLVVADPVVLDDPELLPALSPVVADPVVPLPAVLAVAAPVPPVVDPCTPADPFWVPSSEPLQPGTSAKSPPPTTKLQTVTFVRKNRMTRSIARPQNPLTNLRAARAGGLCGERRPL
jgi:hypothetical protein